MFVRILFNVGRFFPNGSMFEYIWRKEMGKFVFPDFTRVIFRRAQCDIDGL